MKVRLTSDQLGPNPDFDFNKAASDDNQVNRVVPKGTEIEHPDALLLVINKQAEPVDEEAKQAWQAHVDRKEKALQRANPATRPAIITAPATPATKPGSKKPGK